MSRPDIEDMNESEWDQCEPTAFCSRWKGRTKSVLFDMIGWQPGIALGTPEALRMLDDPKPRWLWDRTTERLLDARTHPVLAHLLYCAHTGEDYLHTHPDDYLRAHMGFWVSSVSMGRYVHKPDSMRLTAQEKMAFKRYIFKGWS